MKSSDIRSQTIYCSLLQGNSISRIYGLGSHELDIVWLIDLIDFLGVKTDSVPASSLLLHRKATLKLALALFLWFCSWEIWFKQTMIKRKMLIKEVNLGQRQKDHQQNKALGSHLKKRKQGGVIMICAASVASFLNSSTWKRSFSFFLLLTFTQLLYMLYIPNLYKIELYNCILKISLSK